MPIILLWIVLPIIVIWGIYKIIRLFVLTGESVYEAKKENKEFASYLAKEEQKEEYISHPWHAGQEDDF